ncbi:MAG: FecR domain-containing protein [Alphaproteobacteria bacterium]
MVRYLFIAALAAFLFSGPVNALAADEQQAGDGIIGTIMEVEGKATVTPAGKAAKPLAVKDSIHMKDVISAGAKSRVLVLFIDNTQFRLSENTKITVDEYVFDPDNASSNKASYNVLSGTFQYVSGLIAKKKDPDVSIDTPYGAIGIRGTKLWGGTLKDSSYGVHVEEGQINVRNDGGQVVVRKGEGTALKSRKTAPPKAEPWPAEQLQFIASTVFLANEGAVLQRILGFQGQQKLLQGQFKHFLKFKGPGGMKLPGGGELQIGPGKEGKNGKIRKPGFGGGFPHAPGVPGGFPF